VTDPHDAITVADEAAMEAALAAARAAGNDGDVPVGCVAVHEGRIIASAGNARERLGDPTAHAEVLALRAASALLGRWRLDDVTLVVTLEPCAMCAGALVNARVPRLVYGAADPKGGCAGTLYNLCCDPRLNHELEVRTGVLEHACAALLSGFFEARRGSAG
jgi:tRNA(adenine34) deaminase